jgi:hypothetical protein
MSSFLHSSSTRNIHVNKFITALQKLHKGVQNAPSDRLYYTSLSIMVVIRDTRRFLMRRKWEREG